MKTRFLKILALLLVLSCLFGCAPAQSPETQPSVEGSEPPAILDYDYPELGFSFAFPKEWAGEFLVEQEENIVTVSLGGVPTFSFVSLKNEPGAKEKDQKLEEDGYTYYRENGTHFFYYKFLTDLPEDFCIYQRGALRPILNAEDALRDIWQINRDTEVCFMQGTNGMDYTGGSYLKMKTPNYINYRLGFWFTLPEYMFGDGNIRVKPSRWNRTVEVVYSEGVNSFFYILCRFHAQPVKDDRYDVEEYTVYYPELVHLNKVAYGGANEWMPCTERGFYAYHEWGTYPAHIRNTFTYEQVQELVDSYQVMLTAEELRNGLDNYHTDLDQYWSILDSKD